MLETRIVIHMVGGVVQHIMTPNDPKSLIVILADYDLEGMDGDDVPVVHYQVDPIDEDDYKEYLDEVGKTVDQLTGSETEDIFLTI